MNREANLEAGLEVNSEGSRGVNREVNREAKLTVGPLTNPVAVSVANLEVDLALVCEGMAAEEALSHVLRTVPAVALACSFGAEDMVLLDMVMAINREAHIFYLDTDLLFPETYAVRDRAIELYGIPNLQRAASELTVKEQAQRHGDQLWMGNPDACCELRKVKPLQNVLAGYDAWITGIRRDQSPSRRNVRVVEWDARFGLVKVNPLADWTIDQVWAYIHAHGVPYNTLHDNGYPSIGCTHCTRPVKLGEDPRSGRWSNFEKTECGLHAAK